MALSTSTLRPGFLVSLKTSIRGNVNYARTDLGSDERDGAAVEKWQTERTIRDPEEHDRAKKARAKVGSLIRTACSQSAFGLLCPEVDSDKLEAAVAAAREVVREFNEGAQLSQIAMYVLAGRVTPDDVEAVRAINSEIRELMGAMEAGLEGGDAAAVREAASRVKGIGEMLSTEAQTKVEMAVKTARDAAKQVVRAKEQSGGAAVPVDRSAVRRIGELRAAFLDLDDHADVAAPAAGPARRLDLAAE